MSADTRKPAKIAATVVGTLLSAGALSSAAAVSTAYLANPTKAVCDGGCQPMPGWVCGLNGNTFINMAYYS